eukprot:3935545-Rhodomonas_salina.9
MPWNFAPLTLVFLSLSLVRGGAGACGGSRRRGQVRDALGHTLGKEHGLSPCTHQQAHTSSSLPILPRTSSTPDPLSLPRPPPRLNLSQRLCSEAGGRSERSWGRECLKSDAD